MSEVIREVEFSMEAIAELNGLTPNISDKMRLLLIKRLEFEKSCPVIDGDFFTWKYRTGKAKYKLFCTTCGGKINLHSKIVVKKITQVD